MSAFPELQPLKAGDTLWYVPENRRKVGYGGEPRELAVTKVGRMWATVEDPRGTIRRVHLEKLHADGEGYSSPGQCYRSREAYEAWLETSAAWGDLLKALARKYYPPEGMTAQRIRLALGMLQMGGDIDPLRVLIAVRDATSDRELADAVAMVEQLVGREEDLET